MKIDIFFFYFIFSLINLLVLINIRKISFKFNLIDYQKDKIHTIDTPKFGFFLFINIIFFLYIITFYFNLGNEFTILSYIFLIKAFLFLGFLDDKYNLDVIKRVLLSIFIIGIFYYINPSSIYVSINFSIFLNYILLIIFTLGFVHLVNITDGINGLVPSIFLYSCFYYILKGYFFFDPFFQFFLILSCIGISIFLLPNFYGLCFLGNSGSYLVAIIISIFYTQLYVKQVVEYSDILLIFLVPLTDGLRVTFKRVLNHKNPFKGDYTHIHHMIRSKNLMIISYYLIVFIPSILNFYFTDFTIYISIGAVTVYFFFYKYSVR